MEDGVYGLLILLLLGFVIGVPIAAFVGLARTGSIRRDLISLDAQMKLLRDQVRALDRRPGEAPQPLQTPFAAAAPAAGAGMPLATTPGVRAYPVSPLEAFAAGAPPTAGPDAIPAEPPTPPVIDEPVQIQPVPVAPVTKTTQPSETPPVPMRPAVVAGVALEERLGARLFIWIGGVALALAGAFLVKYSIEQGWLGPAVRCALGGLLGFVFLGVGEWMRAREARIAQSLSAAGVAVLYASLFAAIALYGLIDSASGFLLLAGLTMAAISLSLRQGPFVGLLGLAGGFLTPAIVRSDDPNALVLFGYLFVIQVGTQVLLRRRGWWWLSAIAVAGGFLWAALWLANVPRAWSDDAWLALFLLATSAAAAWAQRTIVPASKLEHWTPVQWQGLATHAVAVLLMAALVAAAGYDFYGWLFFGLLAAGQLVLARLRSEQEPVVALAVVAVAMLLSGWPLSAVALTEDSSRFITAALATGGIFALGGFAALWRARQPVRWALLSSLSTAALFLISYGRLRELSGLPSWGLMSLAVAALLVIAAERVARRRGLARGYEESLGVYALAACGFIAFAIPLELEHGWTAVGWSLLLPAIAWIESRLHIAWFRHAAWVAAGLVLVRLLPGPWILDFPTDATPIFNWLLYGYGIPLAAFAVAAWQFRRFADDALVTLLEAGAVAIGFLLVTLELHHYFQGDLAFRFDLGFDELSCLIVAWLLIALGAVRLSRWYRPALFLTAARVVAALAVVALVLGPLLFANPLVGAQEVGSWPLLNWLIPAYALPALLVALLARDLQDAKRPWIAPSLAILALVLGFAFVTLELRQWFQGSRLDLGDVGNAETYAYSVVWILYGVALLVAGILRGGAALRYASLAIIVLAVGKVFLVDAAALTGLYRVASFLGLGISLLTIGYVYQRFVFRHAAGQLLPVTPPPTQS